MNRKFDSAALDRIAQYLREQGIADLERDTNPVIARSRGKTFSFSDHLRALVYALLSSQRRWSEIAPKLPEVDALFFDYDPEKIREKVVGQCSMLEFTIKTDMWQNRSKA